MSKWKKFMAIGLAVSMIVPSCIPQTLWASEFSADGDVISLEEFGDGAEENDLTEDGNGQEFETGEFDSNSEMEIPSADLGRPDQSEQEVTDAGQAEEGYTMQLYSDGKLEKSYVISYADVETAKAPVALTGKSGYTFKEWNTKVDGTGDAYKPGESIKKLLMSVNTEVQTQTENAIDIDQAIETEEKISAEVSSETETTEN